MKTGHANIDAIQAQIQDATLRLDLDRVSVRPQNGDWLPIEYTCWISVEAGRLAFNFRPGHRDALTDAMKDLFHLDRGKGMVTFTTEDCYEVSAKAATGVHVLLRGVSPHPNRQWSTNFVVLISTNFQRLDFPTTGMEQLSLPEVDEYLRQEPVRLHEVSEATDEEDGRCQAPQPVRDWFHALIPGIKLLIKDHSTSTIKRHPFFGELESVSRCCFVDWVCGGEFCLENDGDDLQVIYRREVGDSDLKEVEQIFDGLLDAVGFMHGCHPWPGFYSHSRGSQTIERWVRPVHDLQKDPILPMAEGRMFFSEDGRQLFKKAAEFFATSSEDAKYLKRSLWLMRETCLKKMAFPVRLLTLCSILEGIVKPYRGSKPSGKMTNADKHRVRWREPIEKMGLPWDWFALVVESYNIFRGHLAHGFDPYPRTREFGEELNAYSRISAAIYILMAKRMGFEGKLERSQWENKDDLVDLSG